MKGLVASLIVALALVGVVGCSEVKTDTFFGKTQTVTKHYDEGGKVVKTETTTNIDAGKQAEAHKLGGGAGAELGNQRGISVSDNGLTDEGSKPSIIGLAISAVSDSIFNVLLFGGIGLAVLAVLYFLVPALQPIIGAILRGIAALVPIVGSVVENLAAKLKWKKPLEETVSGGEAFKDAIDKRQDLTAAQKTEIKELFNGVMQQEQDTASQQTVKAIKATNNL